MHKSYVLYCTCAIKNVAIFLVNLVARLVSRASMLWIKLSGVLNGKCKMTSSFSTGIVLIPNFGVGKLFSELEDSWSHLEEISTANEAYVTYVLE